MDHPYRRIRPTAHWIKGVATVAPELLDPVAGFKFRIDGGNRVAAAGSCFAQHLTRSLPAAGVAPFVAEPGHPILSAATRQAYGYGLYSARYGNIYTSRHLVQLFDRAFGAFSPCEPPWQNQDRRFIDPFRPTIQPGGFRSAEELVLDRAQHLVAVRQMFERLDVLIFTLGLTEYWFSTVDGAVFPLCPGVPGGVFDPARHAFGNLTVHDVVGDLEALRSRLAGVNPAARIILTVSPVPLMATAEDRHVVVSTAASKAILRAACDMLEREHGNVGYFPSLEIIAGPQARGVYFADDLRSVNEAGVRHVMRLFAQHVLEDRPVASGATEPAEAKAAEVFLGDMREAVQVICDENDLFVERMGHQE